MSTGGWLPSTGCTAMSSASVVGPSIVNASRVPSGDHIGECPPPSSVNRVSVPRAKSNNAVCRLVPRAEPTVNASCLPSGEKRT